MTRARLVCKRVNSQLPEARIVLGRWSKKPLSERTRAAFRAAGAASIVSTLAEARDAIVPLAQFHVAASKQTSPAAETVAQSA